MPATIAIVGRPNVGKSTLFNRLSGRKLALVHDQPGVTRDWKLAEAHLGELAYRLIDTAGLGEGGEAALTERIKEATGRVLKEEADAALFLFDAREGLTPGDEAIAAWIRTLGLPVVLAANKAEGKAPATAEGFKLGFGVPIPISAEHGEGLSDLFEHLLAILEKGSAEADAPVGEVLKLAIVGRPNVGKSTLINRLLGRERVLVAPEAGTTRDAISADWRHGEMNVKLYDTAGLRKTAKVTGSLERLSAEDTKRAIDFAHLVVLLCPPEEGLSQQDLNIAAGVLKEGRALVLAAGKIDTVADMNTFRKDVLATVERRLTEAKGVPVVFVSGLTGEGVDKLMPAVLSIYAAWNARVPTPKLNRFLAAAHERQPLPIVKGRTLKARYMAQTAVRPPTFTLFVNRPKDFPESWLRYLEAGLRQEFDLPGVPIRIRLKAGVNPYDRKKKKRRR
jgi:GTPase